MSKVPIYPLLKAKVTMMNMTTKSECTPTHSDPRGCTLQNTNSGMNKTRRIVKVGKRRLSADG